MSKGGAQKSINQGPAKKTVDVSLDFLDVPLVEWLNDLHDSSSEERYQAFFRRASSDTSTVEEAYNKWATAFAILQMGLPLSESVQERLELCSYSLSGFMHAACRSLSVDPRPISSARREVFKNPTSAAAREAMDIAVNTFEDLLTQIWVLRAPKPGPPAKRQATEGFRSSDDFATVIWRDREFYFTGLQAKAVEALFRAFENGAPSLHQSSVLKAAGSDQKSLASLFRNGKRHPAWHTLIVAGKVKGSFHLQIP
ncbi:MAG TPA: hypothetical protein VGN12_13585 [Pirellulales bacterium]|jgi:hypothetical protein